jgi:hypothetical protein
MRERERERNGASKSNVLESGSPVANPKSGPDYSMVITKQYIYIFFSFTCPVRCLLISSSVGEDNCSIPWTWSQTLAVCAKRS